MSAPILEVKGLEAWYGPARALRGIDFEVEDGGVTAVLGANGAGKTTILRALSGLIRRIGDIRFRGRPIGALATEDVARLGVAHVPDGRGTFTDLTVEENLRLGAYVRSRPARRPQGFRPRVRFLSAARGAAPPAGGNAQRRRAADARDRAGAPDAASTF